MKIVKNIMILFSICSTFVLSSCLKDSDYTDGKIGIYADGSQKLVEVHLTTADKSNIMTKAFVAASTDTVLEQTIPVHITTPAPEDITINYEVATTQNSTVIDSLVNIDHLTYAGAAQFTDLNNGTITIKKGESDGYLSLKFLKTENYIGVTFVTGIKITGVSDAKYTISDLNVGILKFTAKNFFEGVYTVNGTYVDYSNANFTAAYPKTIDLITQDATSCAYYDENLNGGYFGYRFLASGSGSYYGSFCPQFTIDEATNKVTAVVNAYGQPSSNGRSAQLDPSGINTYDPVTKTIKVSYWMNQPAVYTPHRVSITEVFTYTGPTQ